MQIKTTNANKEDTSSAKKYKIKLNKSKLPLLILIIILVLTFFIQSCQRDSGAKETMINNDYKTNDINSKYLEDVDESLYLLDYEKIKIESTSSIDVKISNCSLYLDFYGDNLIGKTKALKSIPFQQLWRHPSGFEPKNRSDNIRSNEATRWNTI